MSVSSTTMVESKKSREKGTLQVILDNNIFQHKHATLAGGKTIVPFELLNIICNSGNFKRLILPALIIESCGTSFNLKDYDKIHKGRVMGLCKYSLLGDQYKFKKPTEEIIFNTNIEQLNKVLTGTDIAAVNINLKHIERLLNNLDLAKVNRYWKGKNKINATMLIQHKKQFMDFNGKLNSGDFLYLLAASIYNVPLITANDDMINQLNAARKKNSVTNYIFAHTNIVVMEGIAKADYDKGGIKVQEYLERAFKDLLAKVTEHHNFKTIGGDLEDRLEARIHGCNLMDMCGLVLDWPQKPVECFLEFPCLRPPVPKGVKSSSSVSTTAASVTEETKEKKETAELKEAVEVFLTSPSFEADLDLDISYLAKAAAPLTFVGPRTDFRRLNVYDVDCISGPSRKPKVTEGSVPLAPLLRRSLSAPVPKRTDGIKVS